MCSSGLITRAHEPKVHPRPASLLPMRTPSDPFLGHMSLFEAVLERWEAPSRLILSRRGENLVLRGKQRCQTLSHPVPSRVPVPSCFSASGTIPSRAIPVHHIPCHVAGGNLDEWASAIATALRRSNPRGSRSAEGSGVAGSRAEGSTVRGSRASSRDPSRDPTIEELRAERQVLPY